jgi:hypothetical protein
VVEETEGKGTPAVVVFPESNRRALAAERVVDRLVAGIPSEYTSGLDRIVLREAKELTGRERRRKVGAGRRRKLYLRDCLGSYHRARGSQRPWIELFVDNIEREYPSCFLRVPILADCILSRTLFHELGHHMHRTAHPEHRDSEVVAEEWVKVLGRRYFRRRYWYVVPLRPVLRAFAGLLRFRRWG